MQRLTTFTGSIASNSEFMKVIQQHSTLARLVCSSCGNAFSIFEPQTFSTCCQQPLIATYDLPQQFSPAVLRDRPATMWRYAEMLPVLDPENIVSLGEGMTPIIYPKRLTEKFDLPFFRIKDESGNPTGSFKARGISAAVSKAKEFGFRRLHRSYSRQCRWRYGRLLRCSRHESHRGDARAYT